MSAADLERAGVVAIRRSTSADGRTWWRFHCYRCPPSDNSKRGGRRATEAEAEAAYRKHYRQRHLTMGEALELTQ